MELMSSAGATRVIRKATNKIEYFLGIWREDLATFLSPSIRRGFAKLVGARRPLTVLCDQNTLSAEDGTTPLERLLVRARSELVILKIDQKHVMCRKIDVPSAVVTSLDAALSMNIGVWTPFSNDDVYAKAHHDVPPIPETSPSSCVSIEVRCASRSLVDSHIKIVRSFGFDPDAIKLGNENFILFRETKKRRLWHWQQRILIILAFIFVAQITGFYIFVSWTQSSEIERLTVYQSNLKKSLQRKLQAEKLNFRQMEMNKKIASKMDEPHSVSRAIQIIAHALPDGVVVLEYEISRDRGEGNLIVLGPKNLDMVATLASTKLYRARDVSAMPSNNEERRTYSVGFTLAGWETENSGIVP